MLRASVQLNLFGDTAHVWRLDVRPLGYAAKQTRVVIALEGGTRARTSLGEACII